MYWVAGPDDRALRCRSIWAADALKRADIVEASRVAIIANGAKDDPAVRAYERREPVWIEHLSAVPAGASAARLDLARTAGLTTSSAFPISDKAGSIGVIELYSLRKRPPDEAILALMAEVGHEICEVFRREEAQATALEAVARSRDELEQVLAALPDGITVLDREGRMIYANDAAARGVGSSSGADMLRVSRDEILRRFHWWDEAGQRLTQEELPASQALRGRREKKLVRYKSIDGTIERWALLEAVPITDARGRVHRVVHINHDMTNQHRVETENVRLVGEAQEALRAREDLLAIVSHDLRNPLGVVLASTRAAAQEQLAARQGGTGPPPGRGDPARRQSHEPPDPGSARLRQHPGGAPVGQQAPAGRRRDGERGAGGDSSRSPTAKSHRLVADVAPASWRYRAITIASSSCSRTWSATPCKFTPDGGTITVRATP